MSDVDYSGSPSDSLPHGGGIWSGGNAIVSDDPSRLFVVAAIGYGNPLSLTPTPGNKDISSYSEAVINLNIGADGSLKPQDWFIPYDLTVLARENRDFGSSGVHLLNQSVFSSPIIKRMGVTGAKSGKVYLLDLDNLGGFKNGPAGVRNFLEFSVVSHKIQ